MHYAETGKLYKTTKGELNLGKKRILKALTSTALACVLTASSLVGVFAAQGTRTVERSTVKWAKTVSYNYPKGTQTVQFTQDLGFTMHYFKLNSESGNLVAPDHLAFCIEPEKGVELSSSGDIISTDATTNDKYMRLDASTRRLLNEVLANGYGNRRIPSSRDSKEAYYYATQLLVYETITGIRDTNDFSVHTVDGQGNFQPNTYLKGGGSGHPQISTINTAYNDIVGWVKLCLTRPAVNNSSDCMTFTEKNANKLPMSYNYSTGKYEYTFVDNIGVLRYNYYTDGTNGEKESELNLKTSDITVSDNSVSVSVSKNSSNKCVLKFTSSKAISKDSPITVKINHPLFRGYKTLVANGQGGLMICRGESSTQWEQCYARGADVPSYDLYLKLYTNTENISLQVIKKSADTCLTEDNQMYSLEGAKFAVYSNSSCTDDSFVCELVSAGLTDDGYAVYNSPNAVPADKTYYVKELEAPKGYERSTEILQLKDSGEKNASGQKIYRAEYTELPGNDPINIILKKQAAGLVDGSYDPAELAGAQYRMEYFDGYYYSENELNAAIQGGVKPLRTWVFKTDNRGFISYKEESKVSGSDLYIDSITQTPVLPYGTVRIQEVAPPTSGKYKISDEVFIRVIDSDDVWTPRVEADQPPEDVLIAEEQPNTAGLLIHKDSDDSIVKDLWFRVAGDNGYSKDFKTDDKGNISIDGLDVMCGDTLVKYTVTELGVKASDGSYSIPERYVPDKLTQTVTLSQDKAVTVKFVNHLKNGSISIVKKTSDGKLLDGVKLKLLDKSTNQQVGEVQTTKNGSARFTDVPIGNYYVEEIATTAGYSLLKDKVSVSVKGDDAQTLNPTVTLVNTELPTIPAAGGGNVALYILMGGAAVLALGVISLRKGRRKQ